MSSRARLATFVIAIVILTGGAIDQSFDTAANGVSIGAGPAGSVSPHIDPGTTAAANPSPTPWSTTSTIEVTTNSTGTPITYAVDSGTAPDCAVDTSGTTS